MNFMTKGGGEVRVTKKKSLLDWTNEGRTSRSLDPTGPKTSKISTTVS